QKKTLGILMIISVSLLILWIIISSIYLILFGLHDVDILGMLPFLSINIIKLAILIFLFYLALRLINKKSLPFQKNNYLSTILIVIGVLYFLIPLVLVLIANISGSNPGGWAQPIIAFVWGLILVFIGIGIKKK
ncbi:MAG: hypothetical protein AABW81_04035, partial [Nanoarchaeota archaeon]